jgi:hypothetical protein
MSISVHVTVEASHILFTAKGSYERLETLEHFRKAFDLANKEKSSRLLIDIRNVVGEIPTMDRFEIGVLLSDLVLRQSDVQTTRIAIVRNDPIIDPHRFTEIVATNRGVQLKVTSELQEALEWLGI